MKLALNKIKIDLVKRVFLYSLFFFSLFVLLTPFSTNLTIQDARAQSVAQTLGFPAFCGFHRCTLNDVSQACKDRPATDCSADDKAALYVIQGCSAGASFVDWNGASYGCSDTQIQQSGTAANLYSQAKTSCANTLDKLASPFTCLWRSGAAWGGAMLVTGAVGIMDLVSKLFDIAINQTVLGFNDWIKGDLLTAIEYGWTLFRDLANILIIGLFVFIAISIILGIKSYGQKSLIARVLIVAVLINFSFLFTRIVINSSNFLACQFSKTLPNNTTNLVQPNCSGGVNLSDKFSHYMGIESLKQTGTSLTKIAEKNDGGWITVMHALIVAVISICVALVLLYGAILLIARAVILIFLLITSSLAFATYLLPEWAGSEFGWKAWWIALFRNALLAPIMIMFFAITLNIAGNMAKLQGNNQGGLLGALGTEPSTTNTGALLTYIVILGLLYGSIRISNKFSGAAGQFAWSGTSPFAGALSNIGLKGAGVPLRSLGLLGRNTIGRGAEATSKYLLDRAKAQTRGSLSQKVLYSASKVAKEPTKWDFNVGNATPVKQMQTNLGGFAGQEKRRKEEINQRTKDTSYTKEEIEASKKALKQARDEAMGSGDSRKRGDVYDANKKTVEGLKLMEEAAKKQLDAATKSAEVITKQIKTLENRRDTATPDNKEVYEKEIDRKKGDLKAAADAIARAESDARDKSVRVTNLELDGANLKQMLESRAAELVPKGKPYVPTETGTLEHAPHSKILEENAVEDAYQRFSNVLNRAAGLKKEDDKWAQSMRKSNKEYQKHEEQTKAFKDFAKQLEKLKHTTETASEKAHTDSAKLNDTLKEKGGDH